MALEVRTGKWQETLPGTYDPARAVVVTDPPYGLSVAGGLGARSPGSRGGDDKTGRKYEKGYADDIPWARHVEEVLDLLPAVRHVIRGPATAIIRRDHPQPRRVCIEANTHAARRTLRPGIVPYSWVGWVVYGRLKVSPANAPGLDSVQVQPYRVDANAIRPKAEHRALTPISSALWIVGLWADPGYLVIDPYAGLGTIGLAAEQLGRDYLGSEAVERYADIARAALEIGRPSLGLVL